MNINTSMQSQASRSSDLPLMHPLEQLRPQLLAAVLGLHRLHPLEQLRPQLLAAVLGLHRQPQLEQLRPQLLEQLRPQLLPAQLEGLPRRLW